MTEPATPVPAAGTDKQKPSEYLNAAAFTKLFRHRWKNFAAIGVGLRDLVLGISRRIWYPNAQDRAEVEAEAVAFCLERVDRFDLSRPNAFAYYTTMAMHALMRERKRIGTHAGRFVCMSDLESGYLQADGAFGASERTFGRCAT
jgi:hypothetical protein